jgi:hypothetical protein
MDFDEFVDFGLKAGLILLLCLGVLLFIALIVGIVAYVVMLLWNYVIPSTIGWNALTFWKSYALVILISLLFGRLSK